jgi:hypothetical protein
MKIAVAIALTLMTLATHAAAKKADIKKAEVKKSAQQQKAEAMRDELRTKAAEKAKPKPAEEAAGQTQDSKYFSRMRQGETAKIESGSACISQITATNTATVVFAWSGNPSQKAVLTGVSTAGLFNNMDIQIPYALTVSGAQPYKTSKGLTDFLPVIRPATKEEAAKKGFAENEVRP